MGAAAGAAAQSNVALYRRYRPETFADVIGQEHVTAPLMTALRKNRVNHAYLFSGPRGCGKTTSARILARCLNCVEGPTDVPCGVCDSCVELARGGSGSLDVIEIDAASHGGVDDARDLRERATFAPVRDRYKIFIIDEAHMVTSAGFNALLKIVEEPPEHIKFIFATTEPDKVIGTIRSRTHHYPFRLVPPEPLMAYLEQLCNRESVPVAPGVLSLVVRAGGGSVRDSLSVLDQLMAGAADTGLDYELAVSLLGYTHASLLDDVVDAIAAADAGTVFRAVDRVIQTGHDPRRFVEDLLERFRDLIIVNAMPDSAQAILRGMPEDQISRMRNQANRLGAAELSRAADITNTALTEMTGATSPRLHLELLCARILLPGADMSERGVAARVDRIERRLEYGGTPVASGHTAEKDADDGSTTPRTSRSQPEAADSPRPLPEPEESVAQSPEPAPAQPQPHGATAQRPAAPAESEPTQDSAGPASPDTVDPEVRPETAADRSTAPADRSTDPAPEAAAAGASQSVEASGGGSGSVEMVRRAWPEIMDELSGIRKVSWMMVNDYASVKSFDGSVLELGFDSPGRAAGFNRQDHLDNLSRAINKVLGINCAINPVHDSPGAGDPNPKAFSRPTPPAGPTNDWDAPPAADNAWTTPPSADPAPAAPAPVALAPDWDNDPAEEPPATWEPEPERDDSWDASAVPTSDAAEAGPEPTAGTGDWPDSNPEPEEPDPGAEESDGIRPSPERLSRYQLMSQSAAADVPAAPASDSSNLDFRDVEDIPSADDVTIEDSGLVGRAAVERILGGRLVEERSVGGP
nr:DNA polymerase III subunit gamma and tau [Arthrobacter sp. H14]